MTQQVVNPFVTMLQDMAGEQLAQMDEERQLFHQRLADGQAQIAGSENRVLDRLTRRRQTGPQYSPEVKAIADTLTGFPKLIPTVKAIIMKFMAETEKKVQEIEQEYMSDPTIQEIIKRQQQDATNKQQGG